MSMLSFSSVAQNATLNEVQLFRRCYGQFVSEVPPANHDLLAAVRAGSMTASQACMSLLYRADLSNTGSLASVTTESKSILRNFHDFHRTWFSRDDFAAAFPTTGSVLNEDLQDHSEGALFLTRALFYPNAHFSDVFLGSTSMASVRSNGVSGSVAPFTGASFSAFSNINPLPSASTLLNVFIQKGEIIGVVPIDSAHPRYNVTGAAVGGAGEIVTLNQTLGAGIIGTQPFVALNSGRALNETMDGGRKLMRRWSKAVFSDLLCRAVPVARVTDNVGQVRPNSTLPFATSQGCMQCHGSMDPLAKVVRNVTLRSTSTGGSFAVLPATWTVSQSAETGPTDGDANFHLRPATGALVYRRYTGDLVNVSLSGLDQLGQIFAGMDSSATTFDDAYVCAASRYFKFFTGIEVDLRDESDPPNHLSDQDIHYRNIVINLGRNLRATNDLSRLVQDIIELPVYRQVDLRDF